MRRGRDPSPSAALLVVKSARLTDNGDHDGFADPHETVSAFSDPAQRSDIARSGIKVAVTSNDPRVDCVLTSVAAFGSLGARETHEETVPLTLKLSRNAVYRGRDTPDPLHHA